MKKIDIKEQPKSLKKKLKFQVINNKENKPPSVAIKSNSKKNGLSKPLGEITTSKNNKDQYQTSMKKEKIQLENTMTDPCQNSK